jgi:carboxypeptidase T
MKAKLLVLFFFLYSFSIFGQQKYSKVRIYTDNQGLLEIMKTGIDLESMTGKPGTFIDIEISENEIDRISKKGFKYDVLIDDMSSYYAERYAASVIENNNSLKGINYITPANFHYGTMGGFLTLAEIYSELDQMATLYPNLITPKYIIGNNPTIEGRNLYAVKISDNPGTNEDEPEVLYTSLTHAREPAAMMGLIWYMWYVLENYGSNQEITDLVNNLEMYFVPVVNADGYEYNRTIDPNGGGMWRKNKRDNNGGGFNEYYDGVDLNRNFGYMWGYDDNGSSPYPSDETYRGTSAFSEPETQILKDFCIQNNFVLAHNHHTYSGLIIIPWGYEQITTPDNPYYRATVSLMASENGYTTGQGWEILYVVNGDSNDWMYGDQSSKPKIFAYTQETGYSGFWPTQGEIIQLCEDCYLSNLYLARFATPYAELTDISPNYLPKSGYLEFNLKRMGLSGNGNYTVTIQPDNAVFTSLGDPKTIVLGSVLLDHTDSISYVLSDAVGYGQSFSYTVTVSSGSYSLSKSFSKSYYLTETILEDPGNTLSNWTTTEWSVTQESYHSPANSITDSEGGNYLDNESNYITLTNPVSLTGVENPQLSFWAKWAIETDWDYVQLKISTNNGSTWSPVTTNHTNPGTGSFQPNGEPLFDGSSNWVENTVDLTPYIGLSVKFKFELHSDVSVTEDGFYFDDFTISSTLSSPLSASITAIPGCGANSGTIKVYSTMTGVQTFYLRDNSGTPISDWTGDAEFYDFIGLTDGLYRAQVEKDGVLSPLSNAVQLTNIAGIPEAPVSVQATDNMICIGENTVLSYTGGNGQTFAWYTGLCGETFIGSGNNLTVSPATGTTYYGRWENACGNSDCLSVTVNIAIENEILTQPVNVNATVGDNISLSVSASGTILSYQWRKNSVNIDGANDANYSINNVQVSDEGVYDVIVNGECVTLSSNTATITVSSSVSDLKNSGITISPNPTSGVFTIYTTNQSDTYDITIQDISGRILTEVSNLKGNKTISLQSVPKGIYFLQLFMNKHKYCQKMIVQ